MGRASFIKKAVAVACCAAVLLLTPGIGAWQAVAQVVPIRVQAPIGGIGAVGAAGVGIQPTAPVLPALPILGAPGLAPTLTAPSVDVPAPSPVALPASAVPGAAQADPFARFAQPGPVAPIGRELPPPGAGGLGASALPFAPAPQAAGSNAAPLLTPDVIQPKADGLPADLGDSLHAVAGRANHLGRDFMALRAAFGMRADADVSPVNGVSGSLQPRGARDGSSEGGVLEDFFYRPLSAASAGLARLIGVGRSDSAPQAPPAPLVLKTSADGMALALAEAKAANAAKPEASEPAKSSPRAAFGLGRVALAFIGSLVVAQVGVEALGAAMPTLVQKTFGDFTVVAQLAVFSSIATIIGRQLGPVAVRRFGLKTSYLGASALRLVSISVLAGLLATGHMTLPLMMGFYSLNGLLSGVSLTAMESIPPALVGQDQARIEKFWTWEQTILETIGITGPIVTGAVVASFGFLPALVAFPVTMAASLGMVLLTLKLPKTPAGAEAAPAVKKHGFFEKISVGARLVWGNPLLRTAFLGYTVFMMLNPFLYTMLAPAYGIALLGAAHAQAATSVIGWLTGLYSAGGLLGGLLMMLEQKRNKAAGDALRRDFEAKNGAVTDERWEELSKPWQDEVLRKSMLRWMLLGTAGLAAIGTLAFPLPMLGALAHLPAALGWLGNLTLPALALIPFGVAQVVSVLKLRSFFQSKVPDAARNMPDAMGFFGAGSLAVSTLGLLTLKFVFQHSLGFAPFTYIGLAMLPLAGYYLYLRWRLNRLSKAA